MPKIKPFKAFTYNSTLKENLETLLSPPYDVISTSELPSWKAFSPYQSVNLALAENNEDPSRYQKMAAFFRNWKKEGVLTQVESPSFYLIEDTYLEDNKPKKRLGFISLVETVPHEKKQILPHEFTLAGPKKDRFDLLHEMKAETSQIFLAYEDESLTLEKIYDRLKDSKPFLKANDKTGVNRKVWLINDTKDIQALTSLLESRPALIADGHHRYETAIASMALCPYVQCYFTNLKNPQFSIHPIHRTFSLPSVLSFDSFMKKIHEKFEVKEVKEKPSISGLKQKSGELQLFLSTASQHFQLSRKQKSNDDAEIFSIHDDIIEGILGWNVKELAKGAIFYTHTTEDYLNSLQTMSNAIGLFLPPTNLELVMRLAERGERMPQKSTFFYPKLASGLINFDLTDY